MSETIIRKVESRTVGRKFWQEFISEVISAGFDQWYEARLPTKTTMVTLRGVVSQAAKNMGIGTGRVHLSRHESADGEQSLTDRAYIMIDSEVK